MLLLRTTTCLDGIISCHLGKGGKGLILVGVTLEGWVERWGLDHPNTPERERESALLIELSKILYFTFPIVFIWRLNLFGNITNFSITILRKYLI